MQLALAGLQLGSWLETTWCAAWWSTTTSSSSSSSRLEQDAKQEHLVKTLHLTQKAFLEIDAKFQVTGDVFTMEMWIYIDSNFKGPAILLSKEDSMGMLLTHADGGVRLLAQYYPDRKGVLSKMALQENLWYHVAVVKHEGLRRGVYQWQNGRCEEIQGTDRGIAFALYNWREGRRTQLFPRQSGQCQDLELVQVPAQIKTLMAATSEAVALAPELLLNVAFDSIGKRPDTREAVEDDCGQHGQIHGPNCASARTRRSVLSDGRVCLVDYSWY